PAPAVPPGARPGAGRPARRRGGGSHSHHMGSAGVGPDGAELLLRDRPARRPRPPAAAGRSVQVEEGVAGGQKLIWRAGSVSDRRRAELRSLTLPARPITGGKPARSPAPP